MIAPEFVHMEPIFAHSSLYEWQIAPHAHPGIFQLLFLEQGGGELTTDGQIVPLCPPMLVALPSGCVHAFRFEPGAEGSVLSIASQLLHDPRLEALVGSALEDGRTPRWTAVAAGHEFAKSLAAFRHGLGDQRSGHLPDLQIARLAVLLLLASGLLSEGTSDGSPPGRREQLARRFRALVEEHFRVGWTVERYAAALGTTSATLSRACRESLGKPPGEVVLERILLEAMRNLTFTGSTIGQVADGLGFSDIAYFSRFFRRRTGMSASEFRRRRAWIARGQGTVRTRHKG
ncbi:MAG: helix-turn-helix domain-containing protein [Sphingomonadaceae bacterium]